MARNGSGTYNLPTGNPVITGTTISSTWANNTLSDIASALTQSISADGQTQVTSDISIGGFQLKDVGNGVATGDVVNIGQLADTSNPALGAALVGYADPVAPAYLKTVSDIINGLDVSAFRFLTKNQQTNVLLNNFNDDLTSPLNDAHATGVMITYPRGGYKIVSLTIPGGGIAGAGESNTILLCTDTGTGDIITYTGANAPRFDGFNLGATVGKTSGNALVVQGTGSGEVSGGRFSHITFQTIPTGIYFARSSLYSVTNCNFYDFSKTGLLIDNLNAGDSGDSSIIGCVFAAPTPSSNRYGIQQLSSGGLKIVGNKFNNNTIGYLLNLSDQVNTSDLMIVGNSFEGSSANCIQLQRQAATTKTFNNITISGNQLLVEGATGAGIYSANGSIFCSNMSITGNVVGLNTSAAQGILLDYVNSTLIEGNVIIGNAGTTIGCNIGTHGDVTLGRNKFFNCNRNYSVGVGGFSADKNDIQTGAATITTSTAYGAMFTGTATITFSTAFSPDIPPALGDATVNITGTTGNGVGVQVRTISNTGMTIAATGLSSGGVVPVTWSVKSCL
jgi:hypothetical protein